LGSSIPGREPEIAVKEEEHDKYYRHEDVRGFEEFIESIAVEVVRGLSP
jgi:hypothetical protein